MCSVWVHTARMGNSTRPQAVNETRIYAKKGQHVGPFFYIQRSGYPSDQILVYTEEGEDFCAANSEGEFFQLFWEAYRPSLEAVLKLYQTSNCPCDVLDEGIWKRGIKRDYGRDSVVECEDETLVYLKKMDLTALAPPDTMCKWGPAPKQNENELWQKRDSACPLPFSERDSSCPLPSAEKGEKRAKVEKEEKEKEKKEEKDEKEKKDEKGIIPIYWETSKVYYNTKVNQWYIHLLRPWRARPGYGAVDRRIYQDEAHDLSVESLRNDYLPVTDHLPMDEAFRVCRTVGERCEVKCGDGYWRPAVIDEVTGGWFTVKCDDGSIPDRYRLDTLDIAPHGARYDQRPPHISKLVTKDK